MSPPARDVPRETLDVVDTRDEFSRAVDAIAAASGPIAIDAERASGYRYSQRAYLIQLHREGAGTFLFDPPAVGDFGELNDVIRDEEWVLHAASQDLTCLREAGLHPQRIFDTELGARLAGMPRVGLGTVVEELLGVHLAKEHSAADWSTRPLPPAWLAYAAADVDLLVPLRHEIATLLEEQGKLTIAEQEFDAVLHRQPKPPPADPWRKLSGVHALRDQRALAVARALWHARDDYARDIDVAPGRLLPDASIVAAARELPESQHALASLKAFTGRASRSQLPRWWAAISEGKASAELPPLRVRSDALPPARAWGDRNPEADRRLRAARGELTALAEELAIPLENLLTPEMLRNVAWAPPADISEASIRVALETEGARPWQLDATAQTIAQAFVEADQTPPADESDSS